MLQFQQPSNVNEMFVYVYGIAVYKCYMTSVVGNALQSNALEYSNYFFPEMCNLTR